MEGWDNVDRYDMNIWLNKDSHEMNTQQKKNVNIVALRPVLFTR